MAPPPASVRPAWLVAADHYLGTHEKPGKGSNPIILGWKKWLRGWWAGYFTDDDIAWCALFVNACLGEAGLRGTGGLQAEAFATWGQPMAGPALGAIAVFNRPGGHHVAFYIGESGDLLRIRGGNQSDAVTDTWIRADRLIGFRWPDGLALPAVAPVHLTNDGTPASTDEA